MYHNKESTQGSTLDSSTQVWPAHHKLARCGLQSPNRIITPMGTTLPCKAWSFTEGFKPGNHVRE
jgi:hypothetical protein